MPQFNRWDICEAYYLFAFYYHGGQSSKLYQVFGRLHKIGFTVRNSLRSENDLSDNGREIYNNLRKESARNYNH